MRCIADVGGKPTAVPAAWATVTGSAPRVHEIDAGRSGLARAHRQSSLRFGNAVSLWTLPAWCGGFCHPNQSSSPTHGTPNRNWYTSCVSVLSAVLVGALILAPLPASETVVAPQELQALQSAGEFLGDPPPALQGEPYSYTFTFTGRTSSIVASGLPSGLTMGRDGTVSGTVVPQTPRPYSVKLGAFDWNTNRLVEQYFTIEVMPVPEEQRPDVQIVVDSLPQPPTGPIRVTALSDTDLTIGLTPIGRETQVRVEGLPDWLTATGENMLAGRTPALGSFQYTVIAENRWGTLTRTVTVTIEGMVVGDAYYKTIFDHAIKASDSEYWEARCPNEYPYLDKRHYPNILVQYGFVVQAESIFVNVAEKPFRLGRILQPAGAGKSYVVGNSGTVTNAALTPQHLRMDMVCTNNPDHAWIMDT